MRGKYGRRCGKEMVHKLKKMVIGILSVYVLVLVALGGFLDVSREEMVESGYLKITEVKWTAVEYYYCEPISEYVRKPLTYPSHVINPEYE